MKRFIAAHKSEPGYKTVEEARQFISNRANSGEWYIMEVTSDIPQEVLDREVEQDKLQVYLAVESAVKAERRRIIKLLGLKL